MVCAGYLWEKIAAGKTKKRAGSKHQQIAREHETLRGYTSVLLVNRKRRHNPLQPENIKDLMLLLYHRQERVEEKKTQSPMALKNPL